MMVGTSISNEVDGIRAPTMWPTPLIHHRMAANWSFFERITLRAAVRCKLIACDIDPRHTFWVGRNSYGESRFTRNCTGMDRHAANPTALLDNKDVLAELRALDCRATTAWATSDYDQIVMMR